MSHEFSFLKNNSSNLDFGKTAKDYAKFRQGFPQRFFNELILKEIIHSDQTILDIGTGTGTIARGFAKFDCKLFAIDPKEAMLKEAEKLSKEEKLNIHYQVGSAEDTHMQDNQFDVVIAGQCWHWFDHSEAIKEIKRILKPDGYLIIAHYDWLPLKDSVPQLSEQFILKYNSNWQGNNGNGFYPQWVTMLAENNFKNIETFSFDHLASYTHKAWLGRIRASAGVGGTLNKDEVEIFDAEHKYFLNKQFPQKELEILHRCFVVIARV